MTFLSLSVPCAAFRYVDLPPSARIGSKYGKMVAETSGFLTRMWAWGIFLGSEEGQVSRLSFLPPLPPQCDRLAADCAHELRRHGVSYVSLWPGLVQTESVKEFMAKEEQPEDPLYKKVGEGRGWEMERKGLSVLAGPGIQHSQGGGSV